MKIKFFHYIKSTGSFLLISPSALYLVKGEHIASRFLYFYFLSLFKMIDQNSGSCAYCYGCNPEKRCGNSGRRFYSLSRCFLRIFPCAVFRFFDRRLFFLFAFFGFFIACPGYFRRFRLFGNCRGTLGLLFLLKTVSAVPEAFSGTAFDAEAASELSAASGVMERAATDISGFSSVSDIAEGVVPGSPAVFETSAEGVSGFQFLQKQLYQKFPHLQMTRRCLSFQECFHFLCTYISPDSVSHLLLTRRWSFRLCYLISPDSSRLTPCFPSMVVTPQ